MKFGPMKPHRRNQLLLIGLLVSMSGIAVTLALTAFDESVNLFYLSLIHISEPTRPY